MGHKEKSYTSKLSTPEIYLLNFFSNYRGKNEEFGSSQWGIPKMNDHMQWNYYLRPLKYYLKQRFLSGSQRAEYSLQMSFVWTTQFLKYLNRLPRFQNQEISHKNLDFWLIITKQQQWIWQTGPTFPPGNNWLETRSSYLTVVENELSGPPQSPLDSLYLFNFCYLHMALLGNSHSLKCHTTLEFVGKKKEDVLRTEI